MLVIALAPLVVVALWTHVVVLDGDGFAEMSDEMLAEPEVREALAVVIADEIEALSPEVGRLGLRGLLLAAIHEALDTPVLREAFRGAVSRVHEQIAAGEPTMRLELGGLVAAAVGYVEPRFPMVDGGLVEERAPTSIVLMEREERPEVWRAFSWLERGTLVAFAVFGLALVGMVVWAPARGHFLVFAGLGGALLCVLLMVMMPEAPAELGNDQEPLVAAGVAAGWRVIAEGLREAALWLAGAMGVVALVGVGVLVLGGRR